MLVNKKEVIEHLIKNAETNTYKNELVIAYKESGRESDADLEMTKEIIKKDTDYLTFLYEELKKCE